MLPPAPQRRLACAVTVSVLVHLAAAGGLSAPLPVGGALFTAPPSPNGTFSMVRLTPATQGGRGEPTGQSHQSHRGEMAVSSRHKPLFSAREAEQADAGSSLMPMPWPSPQDIDEYRLILYAHVDAADPDPRLYLFVQSDRLMDEEDDLLIAAARRSLSEISGAFMHADDLWLCAVVRYEFPGAPARIVWHRALSPVMHHPFRPRLHPALREIPR